MASKKKVSKKKSKKKVAKKKVSKKKSKKPAVKVKRLVGRPRTLNSPEEMNALINSYVEQQIEDNQPLLLTGMILHLGLSSRESFDEYKKYSPEYSDSVKRAKLLIESGYERRLHGTTPTGSIFALKNFGWFDKTPDNNNDEVPEPTSISFNVSPAKGDVRVTVGKKK